MRVKGIKKSFRLKPITVEYIRLLKERGHFRSDAEIVDWAMDLLASEENLPLDEIRYQVHKKLEVNKNLQ